MAKWCGHFLQATNYGKHFPRAILTNLTKNPSFGRHVSSSSRSFSENRAHGQIYISTNYGMAGHGRHFILLMNYGGHFHKATSLGKFFNTQSKSPNYHTVTNYCQNITMTSRDIRTPTCVFKPHHTCHINTYFVINGLL